MDNREKESPARTIDSHGSTNASMETIVDRKSINSQQQQQQQMIDNQTATMENSVNNNHKNSLTNSQISMISNNDQTKDNPQHHIYTSPDLILDPERLQTIKKFKEDLVPIKPLHENEMEEKLKILKAKGKSLDLISDKSSRATTRSSGSLQSTKASGKRKSFPFFIVLGIVQLVLSISLVALGSLLIIREAALSYSGSGIWCGGVAAIAGALGVINIGNSRSGFLAVSLICVATSTLGMAFTGTGLVRDINRMDQQEFNLMNAEAAVSAGAGLIFTLALHLLVSIISVYQSAIKLCSRDTSESAQMMENVITVNNATMLSQHKMEEYFKSMTESEKEKMLSVENMDKLMAMWMLTSKRSGAGSIAPSSQPPTKKPPRPMVLVPASAGNGLPPQMLPPGCRHPTGILLPAGIVPPPPPPGYPFPPPAFGYRTMPPPQLMASRAASEINRRHHTHHHPQSLSKPPRRTGRNEANRRQRRKSDSDAAEKKAFTYTGLDRTIANSFLERQEQSNAGSHVDCSSNESVRNKCPADVAM